MFARSAHVVALVLLGGLGACAHNPAPAGWLRPATETQKSALGAFVLVKAKRGDAAGELIAVGSSHMILRQGAKLVAIPVEEIDSATVAAYRTTEYEVTGWGALGTLSTASHGFFFVLSAPVWILATSIAAAIESRSALITDIRPFRWLVPYARFPQGLPAGGNLFERSQDRAPSP